MEAIIEKIIYPGKSLTRKDGKVILTDEGAPGETVILDAYKDKKSYIQAKTREVLTSSPHRTLPRCDHYKICSSYQYLEYPFQLDIKKSQVVDAYSRTLKTPPPHIQFTASPHLWGYRNKVKLSLIKTNGSCQWAYHNSHDPSELVPIGDCYLLPGIMNECKEHILLLLNEKQKESIYQLTLRTNSADELLIFFESQGTLSNLDNLTRSLTKHFAIAGISYRYKGHIETLWGKDSFHQECSGITYRIGIDSFFQINSPALQLMFAAISDWLSLSGEETVADLYCGVGTFGLFLANKAKKIIAIESSLSNILCLEENIRINHRDNIAVGSYTSEEWFMIDKNPIDVLIVDPPRKGLGKSLCENILAKKPKRILYISCDMSTFLRDIKILLTQYQMSRLAGFDFFPHTPHIELCGLLELT